MSINASKKSSKISADVTNPSNYNSETREQVIKLVLKGEKSTSRVSRPTQACLWSGMIEA